MSGATNVLGSGGRGPVQSPSFNGGTSVVLNSDGSASVTTGNPAWFLPLQAGVGSSYWYRLTSSGGTGGVFNPTVGVWRSLSAGATITNDAPAGNRSGTIEIASDSGGVNIVATGTIAVSNIA